MLTCTDCGSPLQIGDWPFGCRGSRDHKTYGGNALSAIHTSERPVVYYNPRTGEHRTPARNDMPLPAVYARQGYVRQELRSASDIKQFERSTGLVHEASYYDRGSATAERDCLEAIKDAPRITGLDAPDAS